MHGRGDKTKNNTFLLYLQIFQKIRKIILKYLKFVAEPSFENPTRALNLVYENSEFMKSVQLLLSSLPISNEEEIQKFKSVTA